MSKIKFLSRGFACFFMIFMMVQQNCFASNNQRNSNAESFYVDSKLVIPGQIRYSKKHVPVKVNIFLEKRWAIAKGEGKYTLSFDGGNSSLPIESAIPVIKITNGKQAKYIALDGHHDILANIALNGLSIPVQVRHDFSDLSMEDAIKKAKEMELVYYKLPGGKEVEYISSFNDLVDDPMRSFISSSERKIYSDGSSRGAEYVLWIKSMQGDRPIAKEKNFIEFIMADALINYGFVLSNDKSNEELVDEARMILIKLGIDGTRIVPKSGHYSDPEYKKYLYELDQDKREHYQINDLIL